MFSTRKMWVWKNRTKWGTMALLGMPESKSSIFKSSKTHKNSTNYLKYQKQPKTKIIKVYSAAEYATRKTTMHTMVLNVFIANIKYTKNVLKFKTLIILFVQHVWLKLFLCNRLKILNLKNYHSTPILFAAAYKRTATAIYMRTI